MALWKDSTVKEPELRRDTPPPAREAPTAAPPRDGFARPPERTEVNTAEAARRARERAEVRDAAAARESMKESLIASGLTIEGKIQGTGHVRIAGHFNGDVQVEGNLTIEAGARLTGQVRANTVVVGGELEGNIEAASRVELLETGTLTGDLKAGSLTVAAGSRMRGRVEFGWESKPGDKTNRTGGGGGAVS
jgi:cytoskeletal protein CcmA (bactofilin family)